jgi:hypothetical protein
MGFDQTQIGADAVAGIESHDISSDQITGRNVLSMVVSPHSDAQREELPQPRSCPIGPELLREREDTVDHDHDGDGDPELRHVGDDGKAGGDPQHDREEVGHLPEEKAQRGRPPRLRKHVGSALQQPLGRGGAGQPPCRGQGCHRHR